MKRLLPVMIIIIMLCTVIGSVLAAQFILLFNKGTQAGPTPTPTSTGTPPPAGAFEDVWVAPAAGWSTWINVQTQAVSKCGASSNATGNGSTNDQPAIQACINTATSNGGVIYLPKGTYVINSGLVMPTTSQRFRFVGHSQSDTTVVWNGPAGGTMFTANSGSGFSLMGYSERITWNGCAGNPAPPTNCANEAANIFDLDNDGFTGVSPWIFDTTMENATQMGAGVLVGSGSPDYDYLRDTFNHVGTGMYTKPGSRASNVLQWNAWYSTFENNTNGLQAGAGASDLNAWYSNFINNSGTDQIFSQSFIQPPIRGNFSSGSGHFANSGGFNATSTAYENNTIINAKNPSTIFSGLATTYIDNKVSGGVAPYFQSNSAAVISVGNQFDISPSSAESYGSIVLTSGDTGGNTISSTPPTLPPEPPYCGPESATLNPNKTTTWTCPLVADLTPAANATTDTTAIQNALNTACTAPNIGNRPVVHLRQGPFYINTTLNIPAACDVHVVGDNTCDASPDVGAGCTELRWTGTTGGTLWNIGSGSKAEIEYLWFSSNGSTNGSQNYITMTIHSSDQCVNNQCSRVQLWMDNAIGANTQPALSGTHLAHTLVNAYDFVGTETWGGPGQIIVNGNGTACTGPNCGVVAVYCCGTTDDSAAPNIIGLRVQNQGNLIAQDMWNDGGGPQYAVFENGDSGNIAVDGFQLAQGTAQVTPLLFTNFIGNAFVADYTNDNFQNFPVISVNTVPGGTSDMFFGLTIQAQGQVPSFPSPVPNNLGYVGVALDIGGAVTPQPNIIPTTSTVVNSLQLLRTYQPTPDTVLPAGVDDVRLTHLFANWNMGGFQVVTP